MKVSYKWLLELTGLDWSVEDVAERLTLCGTACEDIVPTDRFMKKVVVGEITDMVPIEGADKIRKATVATGNTTIDLVCGAPNAAVGQKVPIALLGAELAGGLKIKKARIRGIESSAMICSEAELGISEDQSGIMVLDDSLKVGATLCDALDFQDYILGFELTPNRADSMSAIGIARDLAALAGVRVKYPEFKLKESKRRADEVVKVTIEEPEACGRFTARIIEGVKIGPSPWWLQRRLLTCGMRPISNIVDITNFVMLEMGNPMHAFDLKQFGSNEVVVRWAGDKEKFTTLDEKEHTLDSQVLMITNGREAVGTAGVMGGLRSGVNDQTSTILLEAAWFDPRVVRRTRRKMNMITEASQRFEKGVDPNNVPTASARAAGLFQELCGGEVLAGLVDNNPRPLVPVSVSMRPERCNAILGTDLGTDRMREILTGLEFEVADGDPIETVVPTFRQDITLEIDLIEEVARIEGYDAIPESDVNNGSLYTPQNRLDIFMNDLRRLATAAGFDEMMGHGLADSKLANLVDKDLPQLRILNPVAEDLDIMRNSLLLSALPVVAHNVAHRNLDLRLFEVGKAYLPSSNGSDSGEEDRLLLLVSGSTDGDWRDKPRPHDLHDLTGAIERLAAHFRWPGLSYEPISHPSLEDGQSFAVTVDGRHIGIAGCVATSIGRKIDIKQDVLLAELSINQLLSLSDRSITFAPLPVYPAAARDIAMIVDDAVPVGEILAEAERTAGQLAEQVRLFDLYKGKPVPAGKKSIAISITYRSADRSLSSAEIEERQEAVRQALVKQFKADIRDK